MKKYEHPLLKGQPFSKRCYVCTGSKAAGVKPHRHTHNKGGGFGKCEECRPGDDTP